MSQEKLVITSKGEVYKKAEVNEYLKFSKLYDSASAFTKITKIWFRGLSRKQVINILEK